MSMEVLWRNHGGKKTYIFSTSMFERKMQMWQCLRMKELHFGTKDLTTSTWRALRSWKNAQWHELENSAITPCVRSLH